MTQNDSTPSGRPRRKKNRQAGILAIVLILLVAGGAAYLWKKTDIFDRSVSQDEKMSASTSDKEGGKVAGTSATTASQSETTPASSPDTLPGQADKSSTAPGEDEAAATGAEAEQARAFTKEEICTQDPARMASFYNHLDQQEYFTSFKLPQTSREYLADLFQKLAAKPPTVTRETDDLLTILKNSAHFFRVIGTDNITVIKKILEQEKAALENVLASLYRLSGQPDCLAAQLGLSIPEAVYYDYSCFFLTTMGGRLYLFRRDSMTRMLVTYYAILTIDRANEHGTNSHGVDIRPFLGPLIEEIENSGSQLQKKESYLDQLYALKEKYPDGPEE